MFAEQPRRTVSPSFFLAAGIFLFSSIFQISHFRPKAHPSPKKIKTSPAPCTAYGPDYASRKQFSSPYERIRGCSSEKKNHYAIRNAGRHTRTLVSFGERAFPPPPRLNCSTRPPIYGATFSAPRRKYFSPAFALCSGEHLETNTKINIHTGTGIFKRLSPKSPFPSISGLSVTVFFPEKKNLAKAPPQTEKTQKFGAGDERQIIPLLS